MTRRANGEGSKPVLRKDGRYAVSLRYVDQNGIPKRTSVYGRTPKEARDKAGVIRKRLEADLPAKDRRTTLGAYALDWVESTLEASDRKVTTKAAYAALVRRYIAHEPIGATTLDRLKPSHINAWKVGLKDRGLSGSTIRSAYVVLRSVLDAAVDDGDLGSNPALKVEYPKVDKREARYLDPDEVDRLLAAADDLRYGCVLELLANTGLRRGEALGLRWSDIDFTNEVVKVRGTLIRVKGQLVVGSPKSADSTRDLHMTETVTRILKAVQLRQKKERLLAGSLWQDSGLVFTTESGAPVDPGTVYRTVQRAATRAGLVGVGLHTLRHSAASVMLTRGVPVKVVQEVLGHSSIVVTGDLYGHVSPRVSADALTALGSAFAR